MCKVLYVDDDINSCCLLKTALEEANGRIKTDFACTSLEAIANIVNDRYDLFILNLGFGESDCVEICRWIKRCDRRGPVMILSTPAYKVERENAFEAGADCFLESPLDINTLADKALNYLSPECADLRHASAGD